LSSSSAAFGIAIAIATSAAACSSATNGSVVRDDDTTPPGASSGGTSSGGVDDGSDGGATDSDAATSSLKITVAGSSTLLVGPGASRRLRITIARTGTRRAVKLKASGLGGDLAASDVTIPADADSGFLTVTAASGASAQSKSMSIDANDGVHSASASATVQVAREMLDASFGAGGTLAIGKNLRDVASLGDGRIVVSLTGAVNNQERRVRVYDATGAIDTTFGKDGEVNVPFPPSTRMFGEANLAVLPDGKILYASSLRPLPDGPYALGVARLLANGSLDTTFGVQGWARVPFDGYADAWATGIAVEPDGGVVVTGSLSVDGQTAFPQQRRGALARFTATGAPDGAFGSGGGVTMAWGGTNGNILGIRTIDGATYVVGTGDAKAQFNRYDGHVGRLTSTGALDATFGVGGTLVAGASVIDVLFPTAQHALISYAGGGLSLVSRTTGAVDTTVGSSGNFLTPQGGTTSYANNRLPVLDAAGRILVLMGAIDGKRMEILAYSAAGTPLMSFGGSGRLAFTSTGGYVRPARILPLADGRFIAAANCDDWTSVIGSFYP